ncbi:MAG: hypothetical protein ACRD0W_21545 [Acidimicrobiales bacterium]
MTTLAEVRDGLAVRLNTIDGLRVVDYVPDDVPGYPSAVIFPPVGADYRDDQGLGSFTVELLVMLMVPATIDRKQRDLYALLDRTGPSSVFAAVEADRTLGGLDVDCRVMSATDPLDRGQMASTQIFQRAVTVQAIVS